MTRFILTLALTILVLFSCREEVVQTVDVSSLVDSVVEKLEWTEYRMAQTQWARVTGRQDDSALWFEGMYQWLLSNESAKQLLEGRVSRGDDDLARRFEYLRIKAARAVVETAPEVWSVRDTLTDLLSAFEYTWNGEPVSRMFMEGRLERVTARNDREQIYRTLYSYPPEAVGAAERLVRQRHQVAQEAGFNSYISFRFNYLPMSLDDYDRILTELEEKTRTQYQELINHLAVGPGGTQAEMWDLYALHADIRRGLDAALPLDSVEDQTVRAIAGIGFEVLDLPIYVTETNLSVAKNANAVFEVRPPFDVRLLVDTSGGIGSLERRLHDYGRALYGAHIRRDEPLYNRSLNGPLAYAVGIFFERLAHDEGWYQQYTLLLPREAEAAVEAARDLALVDLRLLLFEQRFEIEAYRGSGVRSLTKLFWDLAEQYLKVPRHEELSPWAGRDFVIDEPLVLMNSILGQTIAAQTWQYLQDNNSTVLGNPDTRSFLVENYFRHGRRYNWRDLVERGTGMPLSAEHLLNDLTS
jgi:hypothetical protein